MQTHLPAPVIGPVEESGPRPLWSVMIPVYNCAHYLRETLQSVLVQDPGPETMEIGVVDNCSTKDDPEAVVNEMGAGRIRFFRQPTNVGAIENFNSCVRFARGEWVHILHGDDYVRPGFYARAQQAVMAHPDLSAVAFRVIYTDSHGAWLGLSDLEAPVPRVLGPDFVARQLIAQRFQFVGMLVRRSAYEELGGFRAELKHCADWDMWNRLAVRKKIFYDPEPLACYRHHEGADSAQMFRTGENVVDERHSIELSRTYLNSPQANRIYRNAMKQAAIRAARRVRKYWKMGERAVAFKQLKQAMLCSMAPAVIGRLALFAALMIVERFAESSTSQIACDGLVASEPDLSNRLDLQARGGGS